jgi:hypothetical protein
LAAISETIVREYFELHGYFVRQQRKFVASARSEEDQADFFVWNPKAESAANLPFVLTDGDLRFIARALVVVKGWHTETFSPAVLANAPEIFRTVTPEALKRAARQFGDDGALLKILVVPCLPQGEEARQQSIDLLRSKGFDAVIQFRAVLADLLANIEVNRNYQKSDLLQILRILKNYDFLREPQMELFKSKRSKKKPA